MLRRYRATQCGGDARYHAHSRDLALVCESGVFRAKPTYVPPSVADTILARTAVGVVSVPELSG